MSYVTVLYITSAISIKTVKVSLYETIFYIIIQPLVMMNLQMYTQRIKYNKLEMKRNVLIQYTYM